MVVKTTYGGSIWIEKTDGKSLFDASGVEWERNPSRDDKDHAAYTECVNRVTTVKLTRRDLVRLTRGPIAIVTPQTVEEIRYYVARLGIDEQREIATWTDQRLREMLIKADESKINICDLIRDTAWDATHPRPAEERMSPVPEKAQESAQKPHPAKNIPKRRKQEGSIFVTTGDTSIVLTPKQTEFLERLSENDDWPETGDGGKYLANLYAEKLDDTMSAMTMGAVLTTLREKGLLTTERARIAGVKTCLFSLTDLGKIVYKQLEGGEYSDIS